MRLWIKFGMLLPALFIIILMLSQLLRDPEPVLPELQSTFEWLSIYVSPWIIAALLGAILVKLSSRRD